MAASRPIERDVLPASTTHRQLTEEQRADAGAANDVIRISVGIETVADLIADLEQALTRT